ncbi:metallophosphoesterase family protein [Neptunomonas qingdaonensis]|uniref:Calcineurin-like phosphoesterase superfamily domain-containing protein n=1 Tax=Neptunomonas qingdaonensis TaxID=1045558 RepID=A0A1I2REI2_9GAMM|nr:metallophosphoesterase family protein [Neptunomonas qingdaonensis]SFG38463.1 Calcineurin-like phosphoesterase superfamily domain-containing protein [Neptunomonas qingdaonensis]
MTLFNPVQNKPLLVFGGPYSNAEATKAMLAEATRLAIPATNVLCSGDLVAYCASPQETINLIRQWDIAVVMGNCEESFGNDADDCGCGFEEGTSCDLLSAGWFNFSKPRISQESKQWMKQLPRSISFHYGGVEFEAVHGGTEQINQFIYASDVEQISAQLADTQARIIIGGHGGIPFGKEVFGKSVFAKTAVNKAWLNAGVIGMPANDGTQDGWYMLISTLADAIEISWHRLTYDAQNTADTMSQSGLNTAYKTALLTGIWPSSDVLPDTEKARSGIPLALAPLVIPLTSI